MLWLDVMLQVAYAGASLGVVSLINALIDGSFIPEDDSLAPSEILQAIVGLASAAVSLSLFFIIGRWIYCAAWNIRHLGGLRLQITPGWAVGWYFVPFANLVMPYRAMKEIWLASHAPRDWQPGDAGPLPLWWGLWLVGNIIGNISFRLTLRAETLEQMRVAEWVGIAQCALAVPLALVFMRIARAVSAEQDRQAGAAQAEPPPVPVQVMA
ncbi:hypothetical protein GCM10011521_23630 [Arenimonas soli]|uniref:DUF4328 domain-containing protein n=1 Tax=Arenimonas soli TaxID=2269504 RepID=A0ABQ1HPU9_9GAMM|nr:DUF4328 domain-containing protein [Arenimonas soli]GGA84503.1 hypothetical protein GCM10011521_23630 [Arenimonas soli]